MRFFYILSIAIVLSFSNLLAQYVSIDEILDANLFKLSDGRIVKLAGVDAPSCSSAIPYLRKVADDAKSLLNSYQHYHLQMDSISFNTSGNYLLAFLYRNYPIGRLNLSEKFIDYGYGKYIRNFESADSTELKLAEEHAKNNQQGIWKFFSPTSNDTIDTTLTSNITTSVLIPDSSKFNNRYPSRSILGGVILELSAGSGFTIGSMFLGTGVGYILDKESGMGGWGGAIIGLSAGYIIGFPWMIYEVAKSENPNLNPWINFGCSWGLTLVTGLTAAAINEGRHPINIIAGLSPIIGSLLYVHLLAPQSPVSKDSFLRPDTAIKSFKDFRDAQTMRMELFRINF